MQVALFAAASGLKIRTLITVAGPVRKDMREVAAKARGNIHRWVHVASDSSDRWQWMGTLFDGKLGIIREHPLADRNVRIKDVGHSQLLRDPAQFHHWTEQKLLEELR
jgi:hypothetical protein